MRNPGGYLVIHYPGQVVERDTITCSHCQTVVLIDPRMDPRQQEYDRVIEADTCKMCMKKICPVCQTERLQGAPCIPFEKKLEALERKSRFEDKIKNG